MDSQWDLQLLLSVRRELREEEGNHQEVEKVPGQDPGVSQEEEVLLTVEAGKKIQVDSTAILRCNSR